MLINFIFKSVEVVTLACIVRLITVLFSALQVSASKGFLCLVLTQI